MDCPLKVCGKLLPQVEEFKCLGVLFTSEGKMEHEVDRRISAACCGKGGAESKGNALHLTTHSTILPSPVVNHYQGHDQNKFLLQGGQVHP